MKTAVAWLDRQAKKLGLSNGESEATVLGGIGLSLSTWHLTNMILGPFRTVSSPEDVFKSAQCLDQLQVVGLVVCLVLLGLATTALAVLLAKWVSWLVD